MREKHLLMLAEEEEHLRLLFREEMKETGLYEIVEFANGCNLLQNTINAKPHILILDLKFGDFWGFDLMEEINEVLPDLPIIIWSAAFPDYADEAYFRGAAAYVDKSFDLTELMAKIKQLIEQNYWL